MSGRVAGFGARGGLLAQRLLKQGSRYHGLRSLLRQGLTKPEFYGDLVYTWKKIVGSSGFSVRLIGMVSRCGKIGYMNNVLQQAACFVVKPMTVGNLDFLFHCTLLGRTSDSMTVPT